MTVTSVVGLQWGDEAKGKIVDILTDSHQVVVRYQGGNNAGHTVKFDGETYKLSLLPTGILRPGVKAVIGNGLVVNPEALLKEIKSLTDRGLPISGENLMPVVVDAVENYCTLGEIADAMRDVFGEYRVS